MAEVRQPPDDACDLTVLFITYNRSDLLEVACRSIQQRMAFGAKCVEFVVADDGSSERHQNAIRRLPVTKRLLWPLNTGLGANCNRGIGASRGEFILQVQDDFEFVGPEALLLTALRILEADDEVGIIQLTLPTPDVAHEVRQLPDGTAYWVFINDQRPEIRDCGARPYSDQPHLKRRQCVRDLGPYDEGVPMTVTELRYQRRVACQDRWRVAHLPSARSFAHLGAERSFNPSAIRGRRLARIERVLVFGPMFGFARPHLRKLRDVLRHAVGNGGE